MSKTFPHGFGRYVCEGDSISAEVDGLTLTARIRYDQDSGPPDEQCDGFWPSLDPKDDGYIGPKSKSTLARQTAHAQHVIDTWKRDEWFYCGVILSVSKGDVELDRHAASLWGLEANYPQRDRRRVDPNAYLNEIAEDLAGEALEAGKAKLATLCECNG